MKRWIFPALILMLLMCIAPREFQAQSRELRIIRTSGMPGQSVVVSIEMVAAGNENAAGFSLNYDPRVLTNPQVSSGTGIAAATLNANTINAAAGQIGIILALPANQTFSGGTRQLAQVSFDIASSTGPGATLLTFGDRPVVREVVDAAAVPLATTYTNGTVQLLSPITIAVAPPEPSTRDEIVIEARGVWNDGCVPANPVVVRDGATITLTTTAGASVCLQAITPFVLTVPIGKLPRGLFTAGLIHRTTSTTIRLGSVSLLVKGGLVNTNASSYRGDSLAPDSIVAAFGTDLATTTAAVPTLPLPLNLAGTTVRILDAAGVETMAPLFFVSPLQVNYHLPAGVAP
ncbi:MAG: cohesin domain-containing protein, partial [Acidobacteriota bacterium]